MKICKFVAFAFIATCALIVISPSLRGLAASRAAAAVTEEGALPESQIPKYIIEAVNSPDRPAADWKLDESRRPAQLMAFYAIKPGMQVGDLWAGTGYTTELIARIVGSSGKVYSQNTEFPEKFKAAEKLWKDRLKEPGMGNLVEVTKPFDAPDVLAVEPGSLDAVFINLNYHDAVGRGYDRVKLNAAVMKALKPGGEYCVTDNSAQAGSGARDANTLHRIDEKFETREIEKAGFKLVAASSVLRNPKDDRTKPFWEMNRMQDRFILKFVKP